jgi:hypothetical protein
VILYPPFQGRLSYKYKYKFMTIYLEKVDTSSPSEVNTQLT